MKKYLILLFAASFAFLAGCSDDGGTYEETGGEVDTIEVNIEEEDGMKKMMKGDTFQLQITTSPSADAKLSFFYTKEGILEVDNKLMLKATGVGMCALTIMAHKGETAAYKDIVFYVESLIEDIEISAGYEFIALNVGQTLNISPYFKLQPAGFIKEEKYTIESDNTSVATVDPETGIITAVATGLAKVHIKAADGSGVSSAIEVNVTAEGGFNMTPISKAGWVASASSQSSASYSADKIIDGNTTTRWQSSYNAASPQWILIDMKSKTTFDRIDILRYSNNAKGVEIWVTDKDGDGVAADDESFKKVGAVVFESATSNTANNTRRLSFYPENLNVRYVKLVVTGTHSTYHGVAEVDFIRRK